MPFERRHTKIYEAKKGNDYGWIRGVAWWDYHHPKSPSGPDSEGWGNFITAKIYMLKGGEFLAISFGCHWAGSDRAWSPTWALCLDLEAAMDFCEKHLVESGVLPPFPD